MKIIIKESSIKNIYLIGVIVYFVALFIENSLIATGIGADIQKAFKLLACIVLIISVFGYITINQFKIQKKSIAVRIFITVLVAIIGVFAKDIKLLMFTCYIVMAEALYTQKILKYSMNVLVFSLIVIGLYSILNGTYKGTDYQGFFDVSRYSFSWTFGFCHYSKLPLGIMYILMFYFLLNKKIKIWQYILGAIISVLAFILCGSKNALICSLMLIILMGPFDIIISKLKKEYVINFTKIILYLLICVSMIAVLLYMHGSTLGTLLNVILNNRIVTAANFIWASGTRFFHPMTYQEYVQLPRGAQSDNSFFYYLNRYGIFALIVFSIVLRMMINKKNNLSNRDCFVLVIFFIAICIDGISMNYGAFILYLYFLRFEKNDALKEKDKEYELI